MILIKTQRFLGLNFFRSLTFVHKGIRTQRRKGHVWGYKQGVQPNQWHTLFPFCDDKNQSPIDIKTKDVVFDPALEKFNLTELDITRNVQMELCTNHGRSAQVSLKGQNIKVTGGSLPGTYIIEQFHFHWGPDNNEGSEHTINGKQYPAELHIVMHLDKFANSGEALHQPDGLAVLGYLIDIGDHNSGYDEITMGLKNVSKSDDKIPLPTFRLSSLIPACNCYYRYYGRQTTPPCANVIWTMFKEKVYLSQDQLKEFRVLGDKYFPDLDLIYNWRKPQPLDDRVVKTNCKEITES